MLQAIETDGAIAEAEAEYKCADDLLDDREVLESLRRKYFK